MYPGQRFNSITHLIGSILAAGGAAVLITFACLFGDNWKIIGACIYGAGMVFVFVMSTIYHSTPGPTKPLWRKLDHTAIFVMIAGSYTPFCLVSLRGPWGWWLFGIIWALAGLGTVLEFTLSQRNRIPSFVLYFAMGLISLLVLKFLITALSWNGFLLLMLGGLCYLSGFFFYIFDKKMPHFHGIWHLFVLGGSFCQYLCIFFYVVHPE